MGLNAIAIHNQLSTQLSFNNNQDKRLKGEINADTRFLKNSNGVSTAAINIKPSTIMIGDSTWTVEPSTVNYSKDLLAINNFKISHKEQYLNINGNATKSLNESLQVDFNDIDVDYILNFVNFTAVSFGGQATGHAFISGALSSKPEAFATCDVKQFTFENGPMGTLAANVLWNSKEEQIEIDETLEYTNIYNLKIPNKEIRKYFGNMFLNRFFGTELKTSILIKALESGDIKKFEKTLGEIMVNMLSHFDLDSEMEKIYQVFMIGLVGFLMGKYEIISNNESGYGRYDLAMIPIKSNEKAYLMEFKISKTEKGMTLKAEEALKQIDEKKYDTRLKARGIKNILKIGIAFYGKKVKVFSK